MKYRFMRKFAGGSVITLLFVGAVGMLALYRNTTGLIAADDWATHTYQVLIGLQNVRVHLTDAEGAHRGYVITGNADYLARFDSSIQLCKREVEYVRHLTSDNLGQQLRLDALEPLIARKVAIMRESIALRQSKEAESPKRNMVIDESTQAMEKIRGAVAAMETNERELLIVRENHTKTKGSQNLNTVYMMCLIGAGVVVFSGFVIHREVVGRGEEQLEATETLRRDITKRDQAAAILRDRTTELAEANETLRHGIAEREAAEAVLRDRTSELAEANETLRHGIAEREAAEGVLRDRTSELAVANETLRGDLVKREQAEAVLRDRTGDLAEANETLRRGIAEREKAEGVLRERTSELAEANETLRLGIAEREKAEGVLRDRTSELAVANETLRGDLVKREQAEAVLRDRTGDLAEANETLRLGIAEREKAEGVLRDRTSELAVANETLRGDLVKREQAEAVLRDRTGDLAEANETLRRGIAEREKAEGVLRDRTSELAEANETLRLGIAEREQAEVVLRQRTYDLEAAKERLAAMAEFSAALNQAGMIDAYRSALGCIAQAAGIPLAVIYDALPGQEPVSRCAVGPDHQPINSLPFIGEGLPSTVARTGTTQTLVGPFEAAQLRLHFGLGDVGLHSVVGWPIAYQGRCLGVLLTAHTAPLTEEHRSLIIAVIPRLAIRMDSFQVEQQRLRLLADLQAQSIALEAAKQEAERASRVKSEFLANMSHELRTPMNSIMGFTQRLIKKLGATLPERELDALRTVDRNAKHLLALINSILDLSKIEAGKMEIHSARLDLSGVVREAADLALPLADGKPVEVHLDLPDAPLMIEGDGVMLKQVVLNLLSNGINYTNAGTVTIAAREATDSLLGSVARLSVRDTGIGIKAEDLSQLFRQFTQLDGGPSRKVGGTGLGLVITERFVRLHGGRIDVTSEFGRGTEFVVLLPLRRDVAPVAPVEPHRNGVSKPKAVPPFELSARSRPTPRAGMDGLRILCVDDEPDVLKFLQLSFQDAGYEVLLATDHDAAIAGAKDGHPDLICLDLHMPGKDGYEVLKTLRAHPALSYVPVIVVSVSSEDARRLGCGAHRYVAKPVDADDLMTTVRDVLAGEIGSALVIEDNADSSRLLAQTLTDHGLSVRTAFNGREGLDRLAESTPSVIVLDLMMPVMDGFTFLEQVHSDPAWSRIPVIILSAKILSPGEIDRLGRASAAILTKGRGGTELVIDAILKAVLPARRALDEANALAPFALTRA